MNVEEVLKDRERTVAIVHYRVPTLETQQSVYHGGHPPQNPACLLQVSLISSKVSPSGNLIRLGETRGDEIMGWTRIAALEVVEILGELGDDLETVVPITPNPLKPQTAIG